jgi:allantoinase
MSDFDLIIRGGSVVHPDGVAKQDIGIKEGRITAIGAAVFGSTDADLDATDFHIFPGLVDAHVRLGEPGGRSEWEGFEHGTRALVAGGVTSFLDMPLGAALPVLDKDGFLAKWNLAKEKSLVDFGLWGGLTSDNLDKLEELTNCGVIGFKAYMCASGVENFPAIDDGALFEGMRRAFDLEQIVAIHAENEGITARLAREAVAEGRLTARDYLESRPAIAELEAIQRAIFFAWETDCSVHISQVSTARAVELIAGAREQGLNISCETSPHYLILTEADAERLRSLAKCMPPLRRASEQAALWEQLGAGQVDMIVSAHSPAGLQVKQSENLFTAQAGVTGCQSTLPLMLHEALGEDHPMPLPKLSELLSTNPARRFRLHPLKGELLAGADADLLIVDLDDEQIVREEGLFYRYPEHTPYLGRKLRGRILRTLLRGQTLYREGHIVVGKANTRLLRPAEIDAPGEGA